MYIYILSVKQELNDPTCMSFLVLVLKFNHFMNGGQWPGA